MPAFLHETVLEFDFESDATADLVARSVAQEIGEIADDRSATALTREDATVVVTVEAADIVALRAATNTWIRLVEVAETIHDLAGRQRT
jgi:KEOPS complex subunit Pcc1